MMRNLSMPDLIQTVNQQERVAQTGQLLGVGHHEHFMRAREQHLHEARAVAVKMRRITQYDAQLCLRA